MNISEFVKKLVPEPAWQDGTLLPYQQAEVPVHYVLDEDCSGGKLKARDPDRGIPKELYGPPGDAIFGWWRGQHQLKLSNGGTVLILRILGPSDEGIHRFEVSSSDQVKEVLAGE
jgi:hypothetical protein